MVIFELTTLAASGSENDKSTFRLTDQSTHSASVIVMISFQAKVASSKVVLIKQT